MRVLYHHRTLADGAEGVHIAAMVDALRSLGHEVRVVGMTPGTDQDGQRRTVSGLRSLVPRAIFELAALALNVPEYLRAAVEIRRFQPELLYKRHARFDVGALLAARHAGTTSILEVNCLFSQPPYVQFEPHVFGRLAARVEAWSLALAGTVITVSSPLARMASAMAPTKVVVVPNGADERRFDPDVARPDLVRQRYTLGQGRVLGWVGVIRDWHGLELLLEALAGLPQATLLVVGDGPGRAGFEARVLEIGLAGRVIVTGRVAHTEMPDHVAAMDIAVVPDERTGVASPMKLLEYMAMGRAVVAPAMDNIRDVVTDRVNGLLFRTGDVADLRERLRELLDDGALRAAIGHNARRAIVSGRTWRAIAADVVKLAQPCQTTG